MTDAKELTPEQVEAIKELKDELIEKFGKREKARMEDGIIPTCCDKCREKDMLRRE